jgi:hypothetical protein
MRKFLCKIFGCKFRRWQGDAGVWHLERFPRCLRCGARNPDFVIARDENGCDEYLGRTRGRD